MVLLARKRAASNCPVDSKNWRIFGDAHAFRSGDTVDAGGLDSEKVAGRGANIQDSAGDWRAPNLRIKRRIYQRPCDPMAFSRANRRQRFPESLRSKRMVSSRDASVAQGKPWGSTGRRCREGPWLVSWQLCGTARSDHEAVTDTGFGQDVPGLRRVVLDFLAQVRHVDADVMGIFHVSGPPHVFQ